jgi:hypothetical protein
MPTYSAVQLDLLVCFFCKNVADDKKPRIESKAFSQGVIANCPCQGYTHYWIVCLCCNVRSGQSKDVLRQPRRWSRTHFSQSSHHIIFTNAVDAFCRPTSQLAPSPIETTTAAAAQPAIGTDFNDVAGDLFNHPQDDSDFSSTLPPTSFATSPTDIRQVLSQANLDTASFMSESTRKYHKLELQYPGLGLANLVRQALSVLSSPSQLSPLEVQYHFDVCRFCVDLTRTNVTTFGDIIEKLVHYFTKFEFCPCPGSSSSPPSSALFIDNVLRRLAVESSQPPNLPFHAPQLLHLRQILTEEYLRTPPSATNLPILKRGIFEKTRPAVSTDELNRFYLTGKNSIYQNIPCPKARMTSDLSHAIISLRETVACFLALGVDPLLIPENVHSDNMWTYFQSPRAKEIYREAHQIARDNNLSGQVVTIHIKQWVDDAQKNRSRTNMLAFNIRTATFLTLNGNGDIRYYTFVIAIGLKKADHNIVEKLTNNELEELKKPHTYYSGWYRKNFIGSLHLASEVRDRPDRSAATGSGSHNHTSGKRFRFCAFITEEHPLTSCWGCLAKRLLWLRNQAEGVFSGPLALEPCYQCADYEYLVTNGLLDVFLSDLNKKNGFAYPKKYVEGGPLPPLGRDVGEHVTSFAPLKLTYGWLRDAAWMAFYNFHYRNYQQKLRRQPGQDLGPVSQAPGWTVGQFETYCRCCNISLGVVAQLKAESFLQIDNHPKDLVEVVNRLMPAMWFRSGSELNHMADAVFHLFFHGIVPLVIRSVEDAVSKAGGGLKTIFLSFMNPLLEHLHSMQLTDVLVLPFADDWSYAGWVGSNKFGFYRVFAWFISHLRYHVLDAFPQSLSFETAEKRQNREERVKYALEVTVLVEETVVSLTCFLSRVMQRDVDANLLEEVGEYNKLFLYCLQKLEEKIGVKSCDLAYHKAGNVTSTLNVKENMTYFASPRNFWDGNDEKAVQRVKSRLTHQNMTSDSWMAKALDHVTKEQYLNIIGMRGGTSETAERYSNTRIFRNIQTVESMIDGKVPIAVVTMKEQGAAVEKYFVMIQEAEVIFHPLSVHFTTGVSIGAQWFCWCHLTKTSPDARPTARHDGLASIHRVVLLLPLQQQKSVFAECADVQREEDLLSYDDWQIPLYFPKSPPKHPTMEDHSFFAIAMDLVSHAVLNENGNWRLPVIWPVGLHPDEPEVDPNQAEALDATIMHTI